MAELIRAVVRWVTKAGRVRDIVCGIELSSVEIFKVAVNFRVACIGVLMGAPIPELINISTLASHDSSNRQYRLLLPLPPAPVQRC
jgi:hypothetical protein